MKKISVLIILAISQLIASGFDMPCIAVQTSQRDYTEQLIKAHWVEYGTNSVILMGISPDGTMMLSNNRTDVNAYSLNFHDSISGKIIKTVNLDEFCSPLKSYTSWSADGSSFTLFSSDIYPHGFYMMKGSYLFTVDVKTGTVKKITEEKSIKEIVFEDGSLCYNGLFSVDGKSIAYNEYSKKGTLLVRYDLTKDAKTDLFSVERSSVNGYVNILELTDGYIVYSTDSFDIKSPVRLSLFNLKSRKEKDLFTSFRGFDNQLLYQIADVSKNRKKILLNTWKNYTAAAKPRELVKVQLIDFESGYDTPRIVEVQNSHGYYIKNSVLSRNGRYAVFVEGTDFNPANDRIMLFDCEKNIYHKLFSNRRYSELSGQKPLDFPGGIASSPLIGGCLFLSDNDFLAVGHTAGYFIFQLTDIKGLSISEK